MGREKSIVIFRDHAIIRMLERNITKNEVIEVLDQGGVIEEYKEDYPYPSCLMFKMIRDKPMHIVVANNFVESQKIVVTVYTPDKTKFESDFKTRKQ